MKTHIQIVNKEMKYLPLLIISILFAGIFSLHVFGQDGVGSKTTNEYITNLKAEDLKEFYHSSPQFVGICSECDIKYFSNPSNLDTYTYEAQKKFFSTPGNAAKTLYSVQKLLQQWKVTAEVNVLTGSDGLLLDLEKKTITNGGSTIQPIDYPGGTSITPLREGGFSISNTNIKGFEKILFDKKTNTFTLDNARVRFSPASKEGQTIEAQRDSKGFITSIKLPAKTTYELFQESSRLLSTKEPLTVYFDGKDPYNINEAAVSISDDKIMVNNKATVHIQHGDLLVFASEGRYKQKTYPGITSGSIEMQNPKGEILTLESDTKISNFISQIKEKPVSYDRNSGFDKRKDLVKRAQQLLNANGARLKTDGFFGPLTAAALKKFQNSYQSSSLRNDGVLDEATLIALDSKVALELFSKAETKERKRWSGATVMKISKSQSYPSISLPQGVSLRFKGDDIKRYSSDTAKKNLVDSLSKIFSPGKHMEIFTINSGYGDRQDPFGRKDFSGKIMTIKHHGIDIHAKKGTSISPVMKGIIISAGESGDHGNQVVIEHPNGYKTFYNHLGSIPKGIKKGVFVNVGQVIGKVGKTGKSTGYHLHFEVKKNGRSVDPGTVTF